MTKFEILRLPAPSTAITSDVLVTSDSGSALIRFDFDRDGELFRTGVRFNRARASRWRAEALCTAWHIDGVYDTIAEVRPSEWVADLKGDESRPSRGRWDMHHFMIHIDSAGCFEFVAESSEILSVDAIS